MENPCLAFSGRSRILEPCRKSDSGTFSPFHLRHFMRRRRRIPHPQMTRHIPARTKPTRRQIRANRGFSDTQPSHSLQYWTIRSIMHSLSCGTDCTEENPPQPPDSVMKWIFHEGIDLQFSYTNAEKVQRGRWPLLFLRWLPPKKGGCVFEARNLILVLFCYKKVIFKRERLLYPNPISFMHAGEGEKTNESPLRLLRKRGSSGSSCIFGLSGPD